MGVFKDHSISKTLRDGNLRNDPEVLDLICDVIDSVDSDMDKAGELIVSRETDNKLEMLATAIDRAENEPEADEDEDLDDEDENEDEDEIDEDEDFIDEDDEDDDESP